VSQGPGHGATGASKFIQGLKNKPPSGSTSFIRADELESAATTAVGLSSPVVRIMIWCLVVAAGIFVPMLVFGRVARRKRKSGSLASVAGGEKGMP
jgi:hypothetical protein